MTLSSQLPSPTQTKSTNSTLSTFSNMFPNNLAINAGLLFDPLCACTRSHMLAIWNLTTLMSLSTESTMATHNLNWATTTTCTLSMSCKWLPQCSEQACNAKPSCQTMTCSQHWLALFVTTTSMMALTTNITRKSSLNAFSTLAILARKSNSTSQKAGNLCRPLNYYSKTTLGSSRLWWESLWRRTCRVMLQTCKSTKKSQKI